MVKPPLRGTPVQMVKPPLRGTPVQPISCTCISLLPTVSIVHDFNIIPHSSLVDRTLSGSIPSLFAPSFYRSTIVHNLLTRKEIL